MKQERRWLKSIIAASTEPTPALPWARGQRRRPESLRAPESLSAPESLRAKAPRLATAR